MTDDQHPMFIPNGYQIYTKPTEDLANFVLSNIRQGHHGCSAYGAGGLGKTTAQQYLTDNAARWLTDKNKRQIGVAARMVMASGVRRTDRAFWSTMNRRLNLQNAIRVDAGVSLERLVAFIRTRCGRARQRRMVLFIDNSQRITDPEYQYLEDLDALLTEEHLSLFLVLVRQSDAEGIDIGDDWIERPSHTVRRWFMDTMAFRPLMGIAEIIHALGRYDRWATWPTPDMPFTRYFAKEAFDRGWTLARDAALILEGVNALRRLYRLEPTESWPMATFTLTVHYLLADIAAVTPGFTAFTPEHVREALLASGYLRLEFVLAKMRMPDSAQEASQGQPA